MLTFYHFNQAASELGEGKPSVLCYTSHRTSPVRTCRTPMVVSAAGLAPTFRSLLSIGGIGSTHKVSSSRTQQRQIDKHSLNKDYSNGKIKINEYAGQELMCVEEKIKTTNCCSRLGSV